jgi:hypothetical protein
MPFTSYLTAEDVARAHQIRIDRSDVVTPVAAPLSDTFRSELAFTLTEVAFEQSESAACETLIYPLLREVWKPFYKVLTLWSHAPLRFDDDLCGVPDFMVARRSPLGATVMDLPYLLVVEAKRDDFIRGWGQCLAAMRAAQRLNDAPDLTLFGIATNGLAWQFGRLESDTFTLDIRPFSLREVDALAAAIHHLQILCRDQVAREPATT